MSLWNTLDFIGSHPLTQGHCASALMRFASWQIRSRMRRVPHTIEWVDDAKLVVERGMTGATGNIYVGLHEYEEMAFLLHFLRPGEMFVDVGANVGSYTVLASAVCGACSVSFEPVPEVYEKLERNIEVNRISNRVEARRQAAGACSGQRRFTLALDTMNHVVVDGQDLPKTFLADVVALDDVLDSRQASLIKIDVEGFESFVFDGGAKAFSRASAMVVELNGSGERYGHSDAELHQRIVVLGFQPARYDAKRRLIEIHEPAFGGNVLYVRDINDASQRVAEARKHRVHTIGASV